jgi:hypothetical protein
MTSASTLKTMMLLCSVVLSGMSAADAFDHADVIKKFGGQLKCPYANLWLSKGPEQAAQDLGVKEQREQRRELQQTNFGGGEDYGEEVFCQIAPGAIGAGHQAGYNGGYPSDCAGTPGESSPYQWPSAWSAEVDSKSVPFGNDTVIYHSKGSVYYRLDRNWKRADTTYTRGLQRSIGQGPCPAEDSVSDPGSALNACRRDSDQRRTMIHRGTQMFFITWKNGTAADDENVTNIEECSWLDLAIVGNIRPDWFLDNLGDDTDVQYLGNQHVYYEGMPKLVKQWRKKDFANQYFTMSMLGNPSEDGIHWPMILNVPGEGFGDDFLTIYTNHRTLTDDDDALFLLDQRLEASGGTCPQMERTGDVGPPTGTVEIPSNLEIDENAWFSNVYTFSPVWEPPTKLAAGNDTSELSQAITEAGTATIGSCYDSASKHVQMTISFNDIEETDMGGLPWMALGYRSDEECVMNKNGADTDIILIASDLSGTTTVSKGLLPAAARAVNSTAITSIYTTLTPLESVEGYADVSIQVPSGGDDTAQERAVDSFSSRDSVVLKFKQSWDTVPEVMHLMYAIGSTPQLGVHTTRMCFEVTQFPACDGSDTPPAASGAGLRATNTRALVALATLIGMTAAFLF